MLKNALKKLLKYHKWDMILCMALVTVAVFLLIIFNKSRKDGTYVRIEQNGKVVAEYSLSEDGEYELTSFYGSNTLVIENGTAYVKESTCRDHICEKMGPVSKNGEMIICIPNKLFIKIVSGREAEYDAVS